MCRGGWNSWDNSGLSSFFPHFWQVFMALLQISEPGQSLDPHQRRIAVGIDLGTTHSLVAAVRHGVAECLPALDGRAILPSVVRYLDPQQGGTGRQIGFEALAAQIDAERATADLLQSEVRAPIAGTVLEIDVRPGERPGSDGLMTLGRTDRMVARVEVFQTEIGRVREGQRVELTSAPLAAPLAGHVERIGLLVGRQNLVSDDTAANTDARVVDLIVRLDSESSARAAGLSNLEAVARIAVEGTP